MLLPFLQAILRELVSRLSTPVVSSGKKQVFLMINCRMGATTSPAAFAAKLAATTDSKDVVLGKAVERLFQLMTRNGLEVKGGIAGLSQARLAGIERPQESWVVCIEDEDAHKSPESSA